MSPVVRRTSLSRALGAFGVLVAFALVLGQLGVVGHYALVAHYLCAQHGTLHHGHASSLSSARPSDPVSSASALPRAHHDSHDECSFPARHSTGLGGPEASEVSVATPELRATITSATEAESGSPVPLLALAPKQSPPLG